MMQYFDTLLSFQYLPRSKIEATESCRKILEHGSSIPVGNCPDFSCAFRQELARNHWKKSGKVPAGIRLPQNHPEPVGLFDLGNIKKIK
jgi:hypothetical protein